MTIERRSSSPRSLHLFLAVLILTSAASAQVSDQVLYSFTGISASNPRGGLLITPSGKMYGTTITGGNRGNNCLRDGCGSVFELIPEPGGSWNFHRIYAFNGGSDGFAPEGNLVEDTAGNLYGTTSAGGANNGGTVYKLTPGAGGLWSESLLHSFTAYSDQGNDGNSPRVGLTQDAAGNLYGTTYSGGTTDNGVVYEMTPNSDGSWSETVIYNFIGGNIDGAAPLSSVTFDQAGNLYGTTQTGGTNLYGVIYQLTPGSGGVWTENVIFTLTGETFAWAWAPLLADSSGNLFGTTCGQFSNQGAVFELTNSGSGWTEKTLHIFGKSGDGWCPESGLTPDAHGNLYGTTTAGGANAGGVVYEMRRGDTGLWAEKVIHSFAGGSIDGFNTDIGLTLGKGGVFYGASETGGPANDGVIYEIKP